ncbi:MAG: MotA/TolQ/ExbB proton channel family protein [Myxococcota bacterium]
MDGCAYCGADGMEVQAGGASLRCLRCGRSALAPATGDAPRIEQSLAASGATAGAPGEVAALPAAGLALLATVIFYGVLRLVPETRLAELFVERGWVPYAISFVSAWALALLAAKRVRLAREKRLLERDWLARAGESNAIAPEQIDAMLARLAGQRLFVPDSFLARRLVRALRHFQARQRVVEVVEFLAVESRADEGRIDASYGLIRVFIWAVPTLGFIGTVIGIGAAVAGFSTTLETATSLDAMRESIDTVTGGLGVAFDTTLLALVMSILIMFPSSALQRLEEGFLGQVDDYCAEHLVRRLVESADTLVSEPLLERLADKLVDALRRRDAASV